MLNKKYIDLAEGLLLLLFVAGVILYVETLEIALVKWSLAGLAVILFMRAYVPAETVDVEGRGGMLELLTFTIVPKVLWIASSVSAAGLFLFLLDLKHKGFMQILLIGGSIIAICLLLAIVGAIKKLQQLKRLIQPLLRAIPLMVIDFWLLTHLK